MGCVECMGIVADFFKSTLVLAGATLYRILSFMVFLSASIGPSALVASLYNKFSGLDELPEVVESAICMFLVSCWAEFSGRFSVHFILYVVAYCQLYIQFEFAHSIPAPHHKKRYIKNLGYNVLNTTNKFYETEEDLQAEAVKDQSVHTAVFLLSLAYLVFTTTRTFFKDLLNIVGSLPLASFSIISNFMLRIGFAILHFLVNFLYFLPCICIAYTSRGYKTPGNTTYFQLTFTAGLAGMVAALFELNRPWPQRRGRIPCLFYENNIIGKNLLCHALIVLVLLMYYRPFKYPKESINKFDSTNWHVINFSLTVAFAVLHVVKVGAHAVLSNSQDFHQNRIDQAGALDIDIPIDFDNEDNDHEHGRNEVVGDGGICARCAEHNNNSGQYNHGATNNLNNNDEPLSEHQKRAKEENESEEYKRRGEHSTILEIDEKMLAKELKDDLVKLNISSNNNPLEETVQQNANQDKTVPVTGAKSSSPDGLNVQPQTEKDDIVHSKD